MTTKEHDLLIKGGTVVDGTGKKPFIADIAVDNGLITQIGDLDGASAAETIDATDRVVTPGFIDLHTHLDAQVGWDPQMRSSSYHGVTTALIGNCGVTFAPVGPANRRYLAELMEAVEDIAADAIMDGLPWDWTSYGEYLDSIQKLEPALNIVGLAGHSSIRFEAMGDKSMDEGVQADEDELKTIYKLVRESVEQGAVGFSTSRFLGHKVPDGRLTPGTWADARETAAIQQAVVDGAGRGGLYQVAPDFASRFNTEMQMFETATELGCHVMFSSGASKQGDGGVAQFSALLEANNTNGKGMTAVVHTRPSGAMFGLAQASPIRNKAWKALMELPSIEARLEQLNNPAFLRDFMAESLQSGLSVDPALVHPMGTGQYPDYDLDNKQSLATLAAQAGDDPVVYYINRLIQTQGKELWNYWAFGGHLPNQWDFMQMPNCIPMLGDAGAHVGYFTDADSPTFLLSELTRDRGVYSLEDAVHRITGQSANVLGLKQRGTLQPGWHADINVIDYENLRPCHPYYVNDFPHNGGRFVVKADGYDATIVGGNITVRNGEHTGARAGRVIREFIRG